LSGKLIIPQSEIDTATKESEIYQNTNPSQMIQDISKLDNMTEFWRREG
jgi:hypothetical protein